MATWPPARLLPPRQASPLWVRGAGSPLLHPGVSQRMEGWARLGRGAQPPLVSAGARGAAGLHGVVTHV